jgi:hypothetical protein
LLVTPQTDLLGLPIFCVYAKLNRAVGNAGNFEYLKTLRIST